MKPAVPPQVPDDETVMALRRDLARQIADAVAASDETPSAAARRLGIAPTTLRRVLRGRVENISLEWLLKVSVCLGLSLTLLTGRVAEEAAVYRAGTIGRTPSGTSALAEAGRAARIAQEARMTPQQRIEAFVHHSRALGEWQAAARGRPRS
jgi:phage repressor protein C with HTH and peptisase S24 domain